MLRIDAYHMHTKTASYARQQISYHMYVKSEYYMRAKRMRSIYTPKSIVECQYQEFLFLFGVLFIHPFMRLGSVVYHSLYGETDQGNMFVKLVS